MQQSAFDQLLSEAVGQRATIPSVSSGMTTAYRICDGEGDGLPGVFIDSYNGHWLVQTRDVSFPDSLRKSLPSGCRSLWWKPLTNAKSERKEPQWVAGSNEEEIVAKEEGVSYAISFKSGYSQGIFLDQRENRKRVMSRSKPGLKVLNAFAYTGAFSVMAALGGAETTTLDLSKTYLDWTWENFAANQLDRSRHHGCKGDAFEWLATFARQKRRFEGIILDPPTFSRNRKHTFRTDRDYGDLVALAAKIISPGGWILCCVNTHRLGIGECSEQVEKGIRKAGRRLTGIENKTMPPEFNQDDYLKSLWVDVG